MNRKNLTAAVLAGLAGAAGIAGTAQAVNLNPDGLGQVLIYPYYTVNGGNDTLLSVVNTSGDAKAVKVRFKEGFNSREVLDFNMYMSAYDVWVAAIVDDAGTPTLLVPDTTCTVPYLYEQDSDGDGVGEQEFLPYDYSGKNSDGGPTGIARAAEGYFEMIEMGTLTNDSEEYSKGALVRLGSADAATHVIDANGVQAPEDCEQLVDNWTTNPDGMWIDDGKGSNGKEANIDIHRNSGGLFGGAAIINVGRGTMFSYDAKAIQGFDKASGDDVHLHVRPGTSSPNLNSGDQKTATVFFGVPTNDVYTATYQRPVDAISAVFMHEYSMNEFNIEPNLNAASEWVITFPTKNWYVDEYRVGKNLGTFWEPDPEDAGCNGWNPGEPYPEVVTSGVGSTTPWVKVNSKGLVVDADSIATQTDWEPCTFLEYDYAEVPIPPFTSEFDGEACEPFSIRIWDREESAGKGPNNPGRPVVSPPPPPGGDDDEEEAICYEVNVLRVQNDDVFQPIFDAPDLGGQSLLKTVDTGFIKFDNGTQTKPIYNGWARIFWNPLDDAVLCESGLCWDEKEGVNRENDWEGLLGMPVTGFWAEQFTNGFLGTPGASVLANYGGLFWHKGNVRRGGLKNTD